MLMLSMQIDKKIAKLFQLRNRNRSVVDKCAALSLLIHLSPCNYFVIALYLRIFSRRDPFGEKLLNFLVPGNRENSLDDSLLGSAANFFRCCAFAEDQAQGIYDYGLACSSLARNYIQPGSELKLKFIDEGVIFY